MKKQLNTGVIGLGVGEAHVEALENHPHCRVTKACDIESKKLREFSERHPDISLTEDANEVLNDPSIDMVCIASFDNCHEEQVIAAVRNGKHVFVEKPICLFPNEARNIREALSKNPNCKLGTNLILRRSPRFLDLKARIEDGQLGKLYNLEGDYNYGRIEKITHGWRGKIPYYSVTLGGAIHLLDLMMWLASKRIFQVSAVGTDISTRGTNFQYPDSVSALLTFEDGVIGKVSSNYSCVTPHFHRLSCYGTEGTFENRPGNALLCTSRDPEQPVTSLETDYPGVHKGALISEFVDSLTTERPFELDADVAFQSLSVCFAIEKALKSGTVENVDYL